MSKVQPPKYNEVTLAVPNTGIRESVTGVPGYRSSLGHLNSPLYKNSTDTIQNRPTINQVLWPQNTCYNLWNNELCHWTIWDIDNVLRREMRFKCFTCGIEFDSIEQLASYKRQHQAGSQSSSGVICLGCGKDIPLEPSKANYSGPLTCPNCRRTMTVTIENDEIVIARLG